MITGFYAALLGVMGFFLSMGVIRSRWKHRVSLGTGSKGQEELFQKVRAHGNFFEYVPLTLLMMGLIEMNSFQPFFLHLLGLSFLVARVMHYFGLTRIKGPSKGRFLGMVMTFGIILFCAAILLWQYIKNFL